VILLGAIVLGFIVAGLIGLLGWAVFVYMPRRKPTVCRICGGALLSTSSFTLCDSCRREAEH
jgi:uncharacterized BrkB/YihY/UPF0761 family membrane protein